MRISDTASLRKNFSTRRAIYAGREKLGDVEQRGTVFVARDRLGKSIGLFPTQLAAISTIAKAAGPS
jgi:hypothetical protein